MMSGSSMSVTISALVGYALAENKALATLPLATQLIATMLTSLPAGMLMSRIGRKPSFLLATLSGMSAGAVSTLAILHGSFPLFILGNILLGIFNGFGNFYRFTAADIVPVQDKGRAISYVLAGGIVAAIVGPNLARLTRDLIGNAVFAGSYASVITLYVLAFLLLTQLKLPRHIITQVRQGTTGRPLLTIMRQPRFIIAVTSGMLGYAVMSLVMTATPLAMHHHAHSFPDTSFVIQWHVLGMFVPSFFTGHLIRRLGLLTVLGLGVVFGFACVGINLAGTTLTHFWLALLLLGISWNFLFIGATTLLTETYGEGEAAKTQAINDFMVFTTASMASLSSGVLQMHFGWRMVNYGAIPALSLILLALLWLTRLGVAERDIDSTVIHLAVNQTEQ